jgi:hypothetical protein
LPSGRRALAILEAAGLRTGVPRCLDVLGRIATRQGRYAEAESLFNKSLVLMSQLIPPGHPEHPEQARVRAHLADLQRKSRPEPHAGTRASARSD